MATKHLKCGWCHWGTEFYFLWMNWNVNNHICLVAIILGSVRSVRLSKYIEKILSQDTVFCARLYLWRIPISLREHRSLSWDRYELLIDDLLKLQSFRKHVLTEQVLRAGHWLGETGYYVQCDGHGPRPLEHALAHFMCSVATCG